MGENVAIYHNRVRLQDPRSIQRLLARTLNAVLEDTMPIDKAKAIGYLARIMLETFSVIDFEQRISALERGELNEKP